MQNRGGGGEIENKSGRGQTEMVRARPSSVHKGRNC